MTSIVETILALDSTARVTVQGDDVDTATIRWDDGNPSNITNEQIKTKKTELETAYAAQAYARNRQLAYPSVADFMEAYTEKEIGSDSTKWDAYVIAYNKVRTDNPK